VADDMRATDFSASISASTSSRAIVWQYFSGSAGTSEGG
jgi:hypothetical protein